MPCRICLEDEGPFISPCHCAGTMKDIHEACLIEWIRIKHDLQCELCHAILIIEFNQDQERAGYLSGFNLQIITNPALHIMIHCLIMLFFCSSKDLNQIMIERFLQFQIIYNGFYILLFYYFIQRNVRNKSQYLFQLVSFPRVFIPIINIFLWTRLFDLHEPLKITKFIIFSLTNQAYIGLYPILHNNILDQINKHRRPILSGNIREHNH